MLFFKRGTRNDMCACACCVRCVLCVLCEQTCARCMCLRECLPRAVGIAFPSRRGDCPQPQTAPTVFAPWGCRESGCPDGGGTHPKRGDPTGTKSSSASDCVDRLGGTLTAGRYGEPYPGKAGGQWTCRPDILESTQHTADVSALRTFWVRPGWLCQRLGLVFLCADVVLPLV